MHVQADAVGQPTLTFKWNTTESLIEFVDYDPQTPWGTGSILMYYLNDPTAGTHAIAYTNAGPTSRGYFVCCSVTEVGRFPGCVRDEGGDNQNAVTSISASISGATGTDLSLYIGAKTDAALSSAIGAKTDAALSSAPLGGAAEILDVAIVDGRASAGWKVGSTSMGFTDTGGPATCSRSVYAVALKEQTGGTQVIWMASKIWDRIQENRKKLGVGDVSSFQKKRGIFQPQPDLMTI
jgi:hypothetical protein